VIDPKSIHILGFFCRVTEYVSEDSSHFVLMVSPIFLEVGKVESNSHFVLMVSPIFLEVGKVESSFLWGQPKAVK
jgi:hypothetical protein